MKKITVGIDNKIEKSSMKKQKIKEVYYICPSCGVLSTNSELLEACGQGGMPYCYCEFGEERIFIGYKRVSKKLWEGLKKDSGMGKSILLRR
jgi:hypothetical protein